MTMETKELMQDNYVLFHWNGEDNVIQVKGIYTDFISCSEVAAIDMKRIKPIPLTEDWLVKFGFVKEEISYTGYSISIQTHNLKRLFIYEYEGEWAAALIDKYTGKERTELLVVKYNYVHSLQNLFWCLTQTQLIGK